MDTIKTVKETRARIKEYRSSGLSIGFVPTMGYLHEGHLSLVKESKKENDVTVVSLFVNPSQFGPNEDLARYPRDLDRDEGLLRELDVDILFYPGVDEMYPDGYTTYVQVENLGNVLCGRSRPTHFRGVATVVLKLFNIVMPDRAYFGSKDAQQAVLLKRMVTDLNFPVKIKAMPIVRDTDGLALSSRNIYLSPEERKAALYFSRALVSAKEKILVGLRDAEAIKKYIKNEIEKSPLVVIDYVEVVSLESLSEFPLQQMDGNQVRPIDMNKTLVAGAVKVGKTRLIDNFILGEV